jgi:hypothetical protein
MPLSGHGPEPRSEGEGRNNAAAGSASHGLSLASSGARARSIRAGQGHCPSASGCRDSTVTSHATKTQ